MLAIVPQRTLALPCSSQSNGLLPEPARSGMGKSVLSKVCVCVPAAMADTPSMRPDTAEEESARRRSLAPPAIASLVFFMGIGFFTSQLSTGGSTWTSNLATVVVSHASAAAGSPSAPAVLAPPV